MLWFLGLIGLGALAVAAFNQLRQRDPAAAEQLVEVLREITTVTVVLAQGVVAALEAIGRSPRRFAAVGDPRGYRWGEDFD